MLAPCILITSSTFVSAVPSKTPRATVSVLVPPPRPPPRPPPAAPAPAAAPGPAAAGAAAAGAAAGGCVGLVVDPVDQPVLRKVRVKLDVVQTADEVVGHDCRQARDGSGELAVLEMTQPSVPFGDQDRRIGQELEAPGILEARGEHANADFGIGRLVLPGLVWQRRHGNAPAALGAGRTGDDGGKKRGDGDAKDLHGAGEYHWLLGLVAVNGGGAPPAGGSAAGAGQLDVAGTF